VATPTASGARLERALEDAVKRHRYDRRLAWLIIDRPHFTADDLTLEGDDPLDAGHAPNAAQNGVGAYINSASRRRLIEFTGHVVRSRAPHRKGGAIRVWRGTDAGRLWARGVLADITTEGTTHGRT
jgi:hypothetical protein